MSEKQIILSGMRSTGKLHLGHYFGVLKNWIQLQEDYNCYYFIADYHALTTKFDDTSELKENIINVALDWLSCGISRSSNGGITSFIEYDYSSKLG